MSLPVRTSLTFFMLVTDSPGVGLNRMMFGCAQVSTSGGDRAEGDMGQRPAKARVPVQGPEESMLSVSAMEVTLWDSTVSQGPGARWGVVRVLQPVRCQATPGEHAPEQCSVQALCGVGRGSV